MIDVDAPDGLATMRDLMLTGLLPRTVAAVTGGGYHVVYATPAEGVVVRPEDRRRDQLQG